MLRLSAGRITNGLHPYRYSSVGQVNRSRSQSVEPDTWVILLSPELGNLVTYGVCRSAGMEPTVGR